MMRQALLLCFALSLLGCGEFRQLTRATYTANTSNTSEPPKSKDLSPKPGEKQPANPDKPGELLAGVAKVEITNKKVFPVNDPLYVKALVIKNDTTTVVLVTVDAVAIGEIGYIGNDYLGKVRARILKELKIAPESVMVNASHCHGIVCSDVDEKTFQAVKEATRNMVPVKVGAALATRKRISENRRLKLKNGKEVDVRHAYSMPQDEEVAEVGPIDPQIGILRLDKKDGQTLAVVYNFACHPIMGVPNGGNTADIVGFASKVIEDNLSDGSIALFVQGCGGDINPAGYKEVHQPRNAEPLGNMLGLSALQAIRKIKCVDGGPFKVLHETIKLPRADNTERIDALLVEQGKLLKSLKGTTLNLKTFLELAVKYNLSNEFPSYYSHRYLHEKMIGKDDLNKLDEANRKNLKAYIENIHIMEQLTRLQTNLALLQKHQARNLAAGREPLEVEMLALRIGDSGDGYVPRRTDCRNRAEHQEDVAPQDDLRGRLYEWFIYYTPTAKQLKNVGGAQEDSDCLLAPEWQKRFEDKVTEMLKRLPRSLVGAGLPPALLDKQTGPIR